MNTYQLLRTFIPSFLVEHIKRYDNTFTLAKKKLRRVIAPNLDSVFRSLMFDVRSLDYYNFIYSSEEATNQYLKNLIEFKETTRRFNKTKVKKYLLLSANEKKQIVLAHIIYKRLF